MSRKKAAPAGANTTKIFYGVLALVAVVGIGGILVARARSAGMATEPLELSQMNDATTLVQQAQGIAIGEESAPIQMLVFSDYMCPACAVWAGQVEPMVKRDFVETGKVRLTYYDFPLSPGHRFSFVAARAARCAGDQGKFWDYHDRLFGAQTQWSYVASMPIDQFIQYGRDIALDMGSFESCVKSDQHAEVVTANKMLGETLGVGGTPTVFVNGRQLQQWSNYTSVKEYLDGLIGS